ncbi:MAG: ARC6/PARC6 family protein, partial [Cyanobacteria bacterium P01_C01_bin.70]
TRQDVHLEQAVCALLLGQAEEAVHALERSQEYEPLAFIREHSQGSPDLLPGLCLYAERWLREEVFTHFRDLTEQQTALKDYFANPQVQAFLETMTVGPAPAAAATARAARSPSQSRSGSPFAVNHQTSSPLAMETAASNGDQPPAQRPVDAKADTATPFVDERLVATMAKEHEDSAVAELSIAERVSQMSPNGQLRGSTATVQPSPSVRNGARPTAPTTASTKPLSPSSRSRSPHWGRLTGVAIVGLLAMGTLGFATVRTMNWIGARFSGPKIQRPALDISLAASPISIPAPLPPEAEISISDVAERTITNWLEAKRQAMGPEHSTAVLENILVDPVLTEWQNRANGGQRDNWYYTFEHDINVTSVEPDDPAAETLTVEAEVNEVAEFFELGVRNDTLSYDSALTMRYELVRQGSDWYVKEMAEAGE